MTGENLLQILSTGENSGIFHLIEIILIGITAFLARKIALRQEKIIHFVDIYVLPQSITKKDKSGQDILEGYRLIVNNISSYPIYLDSYILNDIKTDVGGCCIPVGSDYWYNLPFNQEVKELTLLIKFKSYLGATYESRVSGRFENGGRNVNSHKAQLIG